MSLIVTDSYLTQCQSCNKDISHYFISYNFKWNNLIDNLDCHTKRLCSSCLCGNKGFPKGKSTYYPCKKCTPPLIHWYEEATFGKIDDGCPTHTTVKHNYDLDEQEDIGFSLFD
jgi:hypothetical protein